MVLSKDHAKHGSLRRHDVCFLAEWDNSPFLEEVYPLAKGMLLRVSWEISDGWPSVVAKAAAMSIYLKLYPLDYQSV